MADLFNIAKKLMKGDAAANASLQSGAPRSQAAAVGRAVSGINTPAAAQAAAQAIDYRDNINAQYQALQNQIASSPNNYGNEEDEKTAYSSKAEENRAADNGNEKWQPVYESVQKILAMNNGEVPALGRTNEPAKKGGSSIKEDNFGGSEGKKFDFLPDAYGLYNTDIYQNAIDDAAREAGILNEQPRYNSIEDAVSAGDLTAAEMMANGSLESGGEEKQEGNNTSSKRTRTPGSRRSQMQEYYDWLNTEEGQAFASMYADYADPDQGYTRLRASNDRDAWAWLLGLNGIDNGIDTFRNRYRVSGVDLDSEDALDNLMNYLYGTAAINLGDYMYNDRGRLGMSEDSIAQAGRYLNNQYGWGPSAQWMADNGLDANDIAYLALAHDIQLNGWQNADIDALNRIARAAGEQGTFTLAKDENDSAYRNATRRENVGNYGTQQFVYDQFNPYAPYGLPDSNLSDSFIQWYNSQSNGPKLYLAY